MVAGRSLMVGRLVGVTIGAAEILPLPLGMSQVWSALAADPSVLAPPPRQVSIAVKGCRGSLWLDKRHGP